MGTTIQSHLRYHLCWSFQGRVQASKRALPFCKIRIGIPILPPFKVLAPRAVVEVPTSNWDLLEWGDGEVNVPLSTRAHAKAPHALVLDELGKHKALPTDQGLHSVTVQYRPARVEVDQNTARLDARPSGLRGLL